MLDSLFSIFDRERFFHSILAGMALEKTIKAHWDDIFGNLAKDLSYGHIQDGVLFIEVHNYLWINELEFLKTDILERVDSFTGRKRIMDVKGVYQKRGNAKTGMGRGGKWGKQSAGTFEKAIGADIQHKIGLGYQLCSGCRMVYVADGDCVFCHNRKSGKKR